MAFSISLSLFREVIRLARWTLSETVPRGLPGLPFTNYPVESVYGIFLCFFPGLVVRILFMICPLPFDAP